ncbi:MAG TPA: hypothetical protein VF808_07665 [Ktedonobacterales bacterium]
MTSDKPTLQVVLSAQRARAILGQCADSPLDATPSRAEIASALTSLGQAEYPPAKLDLLRKTFASAKIQQDALLMTPAQAERTLVQRTRRAKPKPDAEMTDGALTVASLDALPEGAWVACARWLAEQAGYVVEENPLLQREASLAWQAREVGDDGRNAVVCALRLPPGALLLDSDLRHFQTIAENERGASLMVLTPAEATTGARLLARELSARLLDRDDLARLLASLATEFARERAQTRDDRTARAKAAASARKKILAALIAADELAKAPRLPKRATGRPAVKKAYEQASEANRFASQALVAWETLVTEWNATFAERAARDGSLELLADAPVWTELGARADHLKKPLLDALRAGARTPGDGDLGYGAWRQALGEELAARCSAILWRATLVDPSHWTNFDQAVNDNAAREASLADNAAIHAAARAARAQTSLKERAGT